MTSRPFEDVLFVSFGSDPEWNFARLRLLRSLEKYFEYASNYIVDQNWLFETAFYQENRSFFQENQRGYGLWAWKPFLIKEAISKFPKSKYIIYLDMGCDLNINQKSIQRLDDYLELARSYEGFAFELNLKEVEWTSKYVLEYFEASQSQDNQVSASVLIFINSEESNSFIATWLDLMKKDNFYLTKGDANFISSQKDIHRHDQSILSLLWHQSKMVAISDETYLKANQKFDSTKPFWVSRNREILKIDSPIVLRQTARLIRKIYLLIKSFQKKFSFPVVNI
jgi:hypothetical protein